MGTRNQNTILKSLHGKLVGLSHRKGLIIDGSEVAPPPPSGLWSLCPAIGVDPYPLVHFKDDFIQQESGTVGAIMTWTPVNDSATGTPVYQDAPNGVFNTVTAAADNDYSAYTSFAETIKFAEGKRLWLEFRFKVAEATTNESTWWVGLSDTLTTGGMQANTAGPLASYDGALIWKTPETAMTVNFETSNAGTQNTLSAFATSVSDTWTRAGFYFDGAATTSTITPYICVNDSNVWTAGTAQNITLAGLEEMHLLWGIKAGPSGAAETMQMDYIAYVQER